MAAVAILSALVFLGLDQFGSSSGTFYEKVTDNGDKAHIPTKAFHQCSIKNDCNYVGIPITDVKESSDADSDVYSAATMQELKVTGKNLQIWRRVYLEDHNDEASNTESKQISLFVGKHFNTTFWGIEIATLS